MSGTMQTNETMSPNPTCRLALFLRSLMADGRAVVWAERPSEGTDQDVMEVLAEWNSRATAELVSDPPDFSPSAALWATRLFYQICQLVMFRDLGGEQVAAVFTAPCPDLRGPGTDWSVDLVLRHLPCLFQLARHLSNADPLVNELRGLASAWPLSSVGVPDLTGLQIDTFITHRALRRLYADRIIAAADATRLGDPRVDNVLRADLGAHRDLAPGLAGKLFDDHPIDVCEGQSRAAWDSGTGIHE